MQVDAAFDADPGADLTRRTGVIAPGTASSRSPSSNGASSTTTSPPGRPSVSRSTSADLVGVMRGVLDISVAYAAERRQYGVPVGSFQAVQHLLADAHCLMEGSISVALHASWAVDDLPPIEALAVRACGQGVLPRVPRARVCETAVQVHGGIGNTWECMVHVYLRRALLSIPVVR